VVDDEWQPATTVGVEQFQESLSETGKARDQNGPEFRAKAGATRDSGTAPFAPAFGLCSPS
jgi:hypothetical protein